MTVKSTEHLQRRVHAHDVLPLFGATVPGSGVIYIDSPPVFMEFFPIQSKSFLISLKQQSLTFGYRRRLFGVIAPFSTTTVIIDFPLSVDFLRIQHCEYLHIVIL